jgi:hypothetical protein
MHPSEVWPWSLSFFPSQVLLPDGLWTMRTCELLSLTFFRLELGKRLFRDETALRWFSPRLAGSTASRAVGRWHHRGARWLMQCAQEAGRAQCALNTPCILAPIFFWLYQGLNSGTHACLAGTLRQSTESFYTAQAGLEQISGPMRSPYLSLIFSWDYRCCHMPADFRMVLFCCFEAGSHYLLQAGLELLVLLLLPP